MALYRTTDGTVVALADRCLTDPCRQHGTVEGDDIVAAYTGFRYAPDGRCVGVPTQANVPRGARRISAFPVHEDGTFVWVWRGDASVAASGHLRALRGCRPRGTRLAAVSTP